MPEFSIIIPVYKVEKYIRQCIESVLNQTFEDFEALVVDDCGGDNSIKIVKEYAKNDKRIKILTHKKNRGLAAARNTALDKACGKYIVCLDSDDWMETNCLEILEGVFKNHNPKSVWFNARKFFDNTNTFDKMPMYNQEEGWRTLEPENIASFADFTWIKAYTRDSIQQYNLCWPEGLTFEDGEFYFEYFTKNPKTYVISDCLINYRHRDDSIVRRADRGDVHMDHIYKVVRHLRDFWIKEGVYDRYKVTIIKLIQNRIRMCYGLNYSDKYKKLSYEFLKDMNYPDDFRHLLPENKNYNPLVSVVVPVYNVEKYIGQCLDSIINQTYENLEIICVDDCGQDNSVNIVKEYIEKDKRIKIINHNKNKGLGGARNTGLKAAEGEYIFFIDSDDWIEKDCIELTVKTLIEENLNAVFYKADVYWENANRRTPIWYKNYKDFNEGIFYIDENSMCFLPYYSWNKGYKREFLIKNNIFWQENVIYEDMEFFFKLFINSPKTYMIDKSLYVYRRRDDSIIGKCYNDSVKAEDLFKVTKSIYEYLKQNNLFDKYKTSFLHLVVNNINNYRDSGDVYKNSIPSMLKCLNDINFPNDYIKEEKVQSEK